MGILTTGYPFFMNQFDPEDYVMLSALQHYVFCPRQFALIHIDRVWDENIYTLRGQMVHERVNIPEDELVDEVRIERALPLWSHRWGIRGIGDVVEFDSDGTPYPVEYKSGTKKGRLADEVQLCAQAMCLEEMLDREVSTGAIYHAASKRRREVKIDDKLRALTETAIVSCRQILLTHKLPPPVNDKRCDDCSLIDACMPNSIASLVNISRDRLFTLDEIQS
jgi:CRISPR-associated exonuclease Cas4